MDFQMETEKNQIIRNMYNTVFNPLTFFKEVDWTEPWLIGLMMFHVLIICVTVITRHHTNLQGIFFMILLVLVLSSRYINEMAASNWKYFSRQQYFDSNGMFISIVFSSPLLINCLIMLGRWLYISGCMTIKIKQAQLRERMRAESRLRRQTVDSERSHRKVSRSSSKPEQLAPESDQNHHKKE